MLYICPRRALARAPFAEPSADPSRRGIRTVRSAGGAGGAPGGRLADVQPGERRRRPRVPLRARRRRRVRANILPPLL
eukprot:755145-Prorocentrum_minimum.AAC.1